MKYVIVGGVAGGAGTAARLRRLEEDATQRSTVQGPYVSYSNCSLPYRLSGTVDQTEKLVLMDPGKFAAQYNIQARVNSRVTALHRERKAVTVRDLESGREYEERYDKLVLATGAQAVFPPIPGLQEAKVFPVKTVPDIARLHQALEGGAKRVTVVGGGFIGVEVAGEPPGGRPPGGPGGGRPPDPLHLRLRHGPDPPQGAFGPRGGPAGGRPGGVLPGLRPDPGLRGGA